MQAGSTRYQSESRDMSIIDMQGKLLLTQLKGLRVESELEKGYFLDAFDNRSEWQIARVVTLNPDDASLTLNYEGWSDRFNETFKLPSRRLAFLHQHTGPYTGAKTTNQKGTRFDSAQVRLLADTLQGLIDRQFVVDELSAKWVNQTLRGHVLNNVDSFFCFTEPLEPPQLAALHELLSTFTRFLAGLLRALPSLVRDYQEGLALSPEMFLVSPRIALAASLVESCYLMRMVLGLIPDITKIKTTKMDFKPPLPRSDKFLQHNQATHQLAYFDQLEGFSLLFALLDYSRGTEDNTVRLPLKLFQALLEFVKAVCTVAQPAFRAELVAKMRAALQSRLSLSVREQKELNVDTAVQMLKSVGEVLREGRTEGAKEVLQLQMGLFVGLLKCQFLDKKIRGMREICEVVERQRLGPKECIALIEQYGIIDHVLQRVNFNSQILKRTKPLFELLVRHAEKDSPALERLAAQMFALLPDLNENEQAVLLETLLLLVEKRQGRLCEQVWRELVRLGGCPVRTIRDFTVKVLGGSKKGPRHEQFGYFGLDFLMGKFKSDPQISQDHVEALTDILRLECFKEDKQAIVRECCKNIKAFKNTTLNFKLLTAVVSGYEASWGFSLIKQGPQEFVTKLEKEYGLSQLLVECLLAELKDRRPGSLDSVKVYLEFIQRFSVIARKITFEQYRRLWTQADFRPLLLEHFNRAKEGEKTPKKRLQLGLLAEIVEQLFTKNELMNYAGLDRAQFQGIDELILYVNAEKGLLEYNTKKSLRLSKLESLGKLLGLGAYWNIVFAGNVRIYEPARKRLAEYYLRLKSGDEVAKAKLWYSFIDRLIDATQPVNLATAIDLLLNFMEMSKGRMQSEIITSQSPLEVEVTCGKSVRLVSMPRCSTLFALKQEIRRQFGLTSHFELENGNYKFSSEEEEDFSMLILDKNSKDVYDVLARVLSGNNPQELQRFYFGKELQKDRVYAWYEALLQVEEEQPFEEIWAFVESQPKHKSKYKALERLEFDDHSWAQLFDSPSRLCYSCFLLREIADLKGPEWVSQFVKKKGLNNLSRVFSDLPFKQLESKPALRSTAFLADLLARFLTKDILRNESFKDSGFCAKAANKSTAIIELMAAKPRSLDVEHLLFVNLLALLGALAANGGVALELPPTIAAVMLDFGLKEVQKPEYQSKFRSGLIALSADFPELGRCLAQLPKRYSADSLAASKSLLTSFLDMVSDVLQHPKLGGSLAIPRLLQLVDGLARGEVCREDEDGRAVGKSICGLVSALVKYCPRESKQFIENSGLVSYLVQGCVFREGKFLLPESRESAYELFLRAQAGDIRDPGAEGVLIELLQFLRGGKWRSDADLQVTRKGSKKKGGYVGLKNQHFTCYMNSVIQQLFHVAAFREGVQGVDSLTAENEPMENSLFQLQKLFYLLGSSNRGYEDTLQFCKAFKDFQGQPINVHMQMDADQFFNTLMDRCEDLIKKSGSEDLIKACFGGNLCNQLICERKHRSQRAEPFLSVKVGVKGRKSVEEGLRQLVEGEVLDGDNAYLCEKCEKKVKTLRRVCLQDLPPTLILGLSRFQFDFDSMQKLKLNDYYEFPHELDLRPYSKEYLGSLEAETPPLEDARPESYYRFRLRGVVVHLGSADSGHYYSLIRDPQGVWNEFNDEYVRTFNEADIPGEAFGGQSKGADLAATSSSFKSRDKSNNAYLLFYEQMLPPQSVTLAAKQNPTLLRIRADLEKERRKQLEKSIAFEPSLGSLSSGLLQRSQGWKAALLYFYTVTLRLKPSVQAYLDMDAIIKTLENLAEKEAAANYFLANVRYPNLEEWLVQPCHKELRLLALSPFRWAFAHCTDTASLGTLLRQAIYGINKLRKVRNESMVRLVLEACKSEQGLAVLRDKELMNKLAMLFMGKEAAMPEPIRGGGDFGLPLDVALPSAYAVKESNSCLAETLLLCGYYSDQQLLRLPTLSNLLGKSKFKRTLRVLGERLAKTKVDSRKVFDSLIALGEELEEGDVRSLLVVCRRVMIGRGFSKEECSLCLTLVLKLLGKWEGYFLASETIAYYLAKNTDYPNYRKALLELLQADRAVDRRVKGMLSDLARAYELIELNKWRVCKKRTLPLKEVRACEGYFSARRKFTARRLSQEDSVQEDPDSEEEVLPGPEFEPFFHWSEGRFREVKAKASPRHLVMRVAGDTGEWMASLDFCYEKRIWAAEYSQLLAL